MVCSLVKTGENAVVFNYLSGKFSESYHEGYHFRVPFITKPVVYETRTRFIEENATTANRDLQNIDFQIRVLFKPDIHRLADITRDLGLNYSDKILSPIAKEVAKTIIAQYSAQQLLSNREQVSRDIKAALKERLINFNILLDEVAITQVSFSREFEKAVEDKQIAQQNAERMKYLVERSKEIKKTAIINAERDCKSIELIGTAMKNNPAYLTLKKIEAAQDIANSLSQSKNKVLLNSDQLLMSTLKFD